MTMNDIIENRRLGQFSIANYLLEKTPRAVLRELFASVIPVRCLFRSFRFEPVKPGDVAPWYTPRIHVETNEEGDNRYTITFARML